MKKTLKTILCLALVLTMFAGCTVVNVAKVGEVNGNDIPMGIYKYAMRIAEMYFGEMDYEDKLTMVAMYDSYTASVVYGAISDVMTEAGTAAEGEVIWDKAYGETTVGEAVKNAIFDELAKVYLAAEKATEKELVLTEEETASISTLKSNLYGVLGSKSSFDAAIGEINLTANQLTEFWTNALLMSKLAESVAEENEIAEDAVKTYFDDNYVRVKHILVKVGDEGIETMEDAKVKAEAIIAKLDAGEDFETLMNAESSDKDAEGNVNGGEEGYIFTKNGGMVKPFEDAAFALGIDEYTKEAVEITTANGGGYEGYHIVKRYAVAEDYFETNKEALTSNIEAILGNEAFEAYMEGVVAEANVVKNESKINGYKLKDYKDAE